MHVQWSPQVKVKVIYLCRRSCHTRTHVCLGPTSSSTAIQRFMCATSMSWTVGSRQSASTNQGYLNKHKCDLGCSPAAVSINFTSSPLSFPSYYFSKNNVIFTFLIILINVRKSCSATYQMKTINQV